MFLSCFSVTELYLTRHFSAFYLTFLTDSFRDYNYICVMWFCQLLLYRSPAWWLGATCAIKKTRHGSCCCTCTGCRYRRLLHDSLRGRWDIYLRSYVFRVCTGSGILEKVLKLAQQFSRSRKSLENWDKIWKNGKVLRVLLSKLRQVPYKWFFVSVKSYLDCKTAANHEKSFALAFLKGLS